MKISVTANDIAKGEPMNAHSCAVARAIRRRVRKGANICSGNGRIWVGRWKINTPLEVAEFIENFDCNKGRKKCKPFMFDLPIPKRYARSKK